MLEDVVFLLIFNVFHNLSHEVNILYGNFLMKQLCLFVLLFELSLKQLH